jgi:hypothetical protein
LIAVVTLLNASLNLTIAAARRLAAVEAAIDLALVAVVARLIAGRADLKIVTPNAVAASRCGAVGSAGVGLHLIAVIADLNAVLNGAITAASHQAITEASVGLNLVTVVASFDALLRVTVTATG